MIDHADHRLRNLRANLLDKPRYRFLHFMGTGGQWRWVGGVSNNRHGRWPMILSCHNFFVCTMRREKV